MTVRKASEPRFDLAAIQRRPDLLPLSDRVFEWRSQEKRSRPVAAFVVLVLVYNCASQLTAVAQERPSSTPEQQLFEWTDFRFGPAVYANRRSRIIELLRRTEGGVLLVPSAHGRSHGLTFRQTDDFMYFTGLELPHSMLAVDADSGRVHLFSPRRDARFESALRPNDFPGRPLADDPELAKRSMIDDVRPYEEFEASLSAWIDEGRTLVVNSGGRGAIPEVPDDFIVDWNPALALTQRIRSRNPNAPLANAYDAVARLRMVKGPEEIEVLRRVCELTAVAIQQAAGYIADGVDERALEAELEAVYKWGGAQRLAFSSIIKSGPNALWPWRILAAHYDRRNRKMRDGELVIFDVGTELDYYVSDVGRTFPVSGRFTEAQAVRLEMVTAVSDAVIAAVRPGKTFADLLEVAISAIPEEERRYMQTGSFFGHHIGMAAGDPNLFEASLEAGMVFTVEPWYYNHDDGIAVFVEDVILVTADGAEVLTSMLPRDTEELSAMVGRR